MSFTVNEKGQASFIKYHDQHKEEGGNMPNEFALTCLVRDSVRNKDYKIFKKDNINSIEKFDVVSYTNWVGDVFFGVCVGKDSNVLQLQIGTKDGVLQKFLEG